MMILFEFPQEQNSILTAAYERSQLREETFPITGSHIYSLNQLTHMSHFV